MTAAAAAFAYAATIALVGFILWLRERHKPTTHERLDALEASHKKLWAAFSEMSISSMDTRAIVDNLQLRTGLNPKR